MTAPPPRFSEAGDAAHDGRAHARARGFAEAAAGPLEAQFLLPSPAMRRSSLVLPCLSVSLLLAACTGVNDPLNPIPGVGDGGPAPGGSGGATGGSGGSGGGSGGGGGGGAGGKGGAGTGGSGGAIGSGGTAGTTPVPDAGPIKPPPPDAGPMGCPGVGCAIFCPNGYEKDAKGCEICKCRPVGCPTIACAPQPPCPYGTVKDANGCSTCTCAPPPPTACKLTECPIPPPFVPTCNGQPTGGFVCERPAPDAPCSLKTVCPGDACAPGACGAGGTGGAALVPPPDTRCPAQCQRNAVHQCTWIIPPCPPLPPCSKEECAAAPRPPIRCAPGQAEEATCNRGRDEKCAWQVTCVPVPAGACGNVRDRLACDKDPRCRWLDPGCNDPALPIAGCYDRADLDCGPMKPCAGGRTCLQRIYNPCVPTRPGEPTCAACGVGINVCL